MPPPVCDAFQNATTVFVAKATESKTVNGKEEITLKVTERLKNDPNDTETVENGGMCDAVFVKGKTYLVYASSGGSPIRVGLCSRTTTIDKAKADLAYARGFEKRTNAMLEGTVSVGDVKRAGVEVRVRDSKIKTKTDKTGRFKLELPPGRYTLDVVDPKARAAVEANEVVSLATATSCAYRDIELVWNGRVRGKLLGADGAPIANIQLQLVASGETRAGNQFTMTDAKGAYEFSGVQAGEYTIVVYSTKGVPKTTYYPGVDDASKAKPIKLSQSGLAQKIDFRLLP